MLDIVIRMALSKRLQFIFENLLPHQAVWDFCCDHGYLGEAAAKSGLFPEVCFVDQVPHIIHHLEKRLSSEQGFEKCRFLISKAEDLQEPVVGTAVIAGVGGYTIKKVLQNLRTKKLLQTQRLILAPQRDAQMLQEWLPELNSGDWFISVTTLSIEERNRVRPIFLVERSK